MNVLFNDFKYDKEIKTLSKIKSFLLLQKLNGDLN